MPKFKSSPVLTCDICEFKATNGYIFKRHLHRCFSLHGIASKRSTSRNPIRLKGTEGLLSKDSSYETSQDLLSGGSLDSGDDHVLTEDGGTTEISQNTEEHQLEDHQLDNVASLPWEPAASSELVLTPADVSPEDLDVDTEINENTTGDICQVMPGAPYCRLYSCGECPYECKSAREYLLHQRNVHFRKMKIFACCVCDYASRYSNKVERHLTVHSRAAANGEGQGRELKVIELTGDSQTAEDSSLPLPGGLSKEGAPERPKIQPLKLKRLNIKMPFKVARTYKYKSASMFALNQRTNQKMSPGADAGSNVKDVYRLVLSEDGSHHYQCRDCLYYASVPSSVKKHHSLCHSRLLCCPHCSLSTTGQGIFYEHLVSHEGFGYLKCPECSYVTNTKSNLEKHRSFHNGNFPVRCSVCSFSADSESKIKRHVATQHRPPNASMEEQLSVPGISYDGSLGGHELNSQMVGPIGGAQSDQEMVYSKVSKDDEPTDGGRIIEYRCPKCPMICYRRGNFTRHLTAKHKVNQTAAAALSKSIEGKIAKVLKRKRAVSAFTGLKQMRFQTMENLKCSHCSYIAKWPSDLRRHMQVHTLIKRFKCSMCTNKYKYLGDLNVHMRRDHNTEPPDNIAREVATSDALTKASPAMFRCPVCPYASQSKAELEQHSRNHSNTEKTYQCRQCDYQTYWRGDVSRHLFRHHKIVLSKEATEIWAYFLHRPDIKPLTKQGSAAAAAAAAVAAAASLSMSPLLPDMTETKPSAQNAAAGALSEEAADHTCQVPGQRPPAAAATVFLREGSFICEHPNCDFKTTISDRMEIHLAVHQNLKLFMCPTCGKRTNWKWDVVKHMNKVHMNTSAVIEDVITLSIEQAKATIQDYLNHHEKKSKKMVVSYCSLCTFKSLDRNRVVRHLASIHKHEHGTVLTLPMIRSESLENPLNIQTEEGSQSLDSERFLLEACCEELPVRKFVEPPSEELAQFEKPYACAICRKAGASKGDVKKHYNYTHPYKDVRIVYVGDETEFNYYTGEVYHKSSTSQQSLDSPEMKPGMPPLSPLGKIVRPDSKFSNPKMHGYVKPFKCSICGLRSNWKWDLKKHLRSKHPNEGGFVILLSIEEASETYGKDCTPSHPKNEDFLSVFSTSPSQVPPSNPAPVTTDEHVFKPPPNIKAEILEDSNGDDSQDELNSFSSFLSQSSPSSASPSPRPRGRESSTSLDPSRRQWRCSACNYISNWRRNMARHIHRKHPEEEDTVQVLALHETPESALLGAAEDLSQNKEVVGIESSSCVVKQEVVEKKVNFVQSDMRLWNCCHCAYSSRLRTHIIVHMQQHEVKPFACGICGVPFMNRGPLHRHLQKVHKRSDYLKLCKVNIHYNEQPGESNAEEVTRSEYINSYFCRLCSLESLDRSEIVKHLVAIHGSLESDNNILKIQKHIGGSAKRRAALERFSKNTTAQKWNKKVHFCTICPFRTLKKSMLAFHMTYHKPNSVNKFKCKYCPYYVGAVRLLHQHQRKWHKESSGQIWGQEEQATPTQSPTKLEANSTSPLGTPRRHCCEKCPYTTNSKNDFIYHKQFHRPKRTAEFKCEYCDYWVVHKRLLKQHTRLHTTVLPSSGTAVHISPAKSLCSDPGLVYDPLELTELAAIKQKMISAKITASLSHSPNVSPMKLASQCSVDSKPGYVIKNGLYRKLHKCRFCPYTNIRSRNMQLHEMMHGHRASSYPLMKCPYCDYYVGSKGLLSHHMKVHQKTYGDTPENDAELGDMTDLLDNDAELGDMADPLDNDEECDQEIPQQQKVDTLLQISRFKRFGCERCPYASAKRQHFVRHLELHGSRQRYTCQYCDYSVPSNNLLLQHTKLHMLPNQNLLASQSITNLQHLGEVPADVALASALPPADSDTAVTISVIHDHLGLYENSIYDSEPKKLYRCDRCPYANIRRDYLLSHLKFHMVPSSLVCPYCDYSAPKQPLLTQHIRVHFCPLPELSDWLLENGQTERETSQRHLDLAEALKVAHEYQNKSKKKDKGKSSISNTDKLAGKQDEMSEGKENVQASDAGDSKLIYVCQYCDRDFLASDKLVKHELQHLIGNHFEATMQILSDRQRLQQQKQQHTQAGQPTEGGCVEKTSSQEGTNTEATLSTERNLCDSLLLAGLSSKDTGDNKQAIGDSVKDSCNMQTDIMKVDEEENNAAFESASCQIADLSASNEAMRDVMRVQVGIDDTELKTDYDSQSAEGCNLSAEGGIMLGCVEKEGKRKRKKVFKDGSDVTRMMKSEKKSWKKAGTTKQKQNKTNPSCPEAELMELGSCAGDTIMVEDVETNHTHRDIIGSDSQVEDLDPSGQMRKSEGSQEEGGEKIVRVLEDNQEERGEKIVRMLEDNQEERGEKIVRMLEDNQEESGEKIVRMLEDNQEERGEKIVRMLEDNQEERGEKIVRMLEDNQEESAEKIVRMLEDNQEERGEKIVRMLEDNQKESGEKIVRMLEDNPDHSSQVVKPEADQERQEGEKEEGMSVDMEKLSLPETDICHRYEIKPGSDMKESV